MAPATPVVDPPVPVLPPVPFTAGAWTTAAGTKVVSPDGPISVVPSGVLITALVSGSVYSS
jgi:hypothetical protein